MMESHNFTFMYCSSRSGSWITGRSFLIFLFRKGFLYFLEVASLKIKWNGFLENNLNFSPCFVSLVFLGFLSKLIKPFLRSFVHFYLIDYGKGYGVNELWIPYAFVILFVVVFFLFEVMTKRKRKAKKKKRKNHPWYPFFNW